MDVEATEEASVAEINGVTEVNGVAEVNEVAEVTHVHTDVTPGSGTLSIIIGTGIRMESA